MRGRNTGAAFLAVVALLLGGGLAQADVKILKYDKQGRVIGVESGSGDRRDSGAFDRDGGGGPAAAVEPGEVLVLDPPARFASAIKRLGFRVIESVDLRSLDMRLVVLKVPRGETVAGAIRILQRGFPALNIEANHRFAAQAGRDRHHARAAMGWPAAPRICGTGLSLGMIDSGVDLGHPALKGRVVEFQSFHRRSRKPGTSVHGTAVAAMLVGNRQWGGLLPDASLKAANIFETTRTGREVANGVGLLKALNWLTRKRVHVINLSVTGGDNQFLRVAVDRIRRRGVMMIAAAGNWGRDEPAYPAAYAPVIAVTAVAGDGAGNAVYRRANSGSWIDFAAPGVKLWTAVPNGGKVQSGTSFAVPFIAAFAAVEVSRTTHLSPSNLRRILRKDTVDLGQPGKDEVFGWGLVDRKLACE